MTLVGLEHLISVCRVAELPVELAAARTPLRAGELVLRTPLDPEVAVFLLQANGGRLNDMYLFGGPGATTEIEAFNAGMRQAVGDASLDRFLLIGQFESQAVYMATVPALADAEGRQPVALIDISEAMVILPLASSFDRSLNLYARYLETLAMHYESIQAGLMDCFFPTCVPELVASDRPLRDSLDRFASYVGPALVSDDWMAQLKHSGPS